MDDWIMLLQVCSPWSEMALDDVTGEFRAVLQELLQASDLDPNLRAERLRRVARRHGAFRRHQGSAAVVLAEEIAFARQAIEIELVRGGASRFVVRTIQDSLAPVMTAVERAMYAGYVDCDDGGPRDA